MIRMPVWAIAACGLCVQPAVAATVNLIADTEMPVASFTAHAINTTSGFSFGVGQALTGGNPGAYRTISDSSVPGVAQSILAGHFTHTVPPNTLGDLTGDGIVNVADFNILAGNFGCRT